MNNMDTELAIGIDLGTTNSCVAVYRNNRVDILENESGSRTTPSFVTFTKNYIFTGKEAVEEAHKYPKTAVFEAKRLIGQKFSDPKVTEDIKMFPFPVFNDFGFPRIRIEFDGDKRDYYPEDISAYILQRMKKIAETRLKQTITSAVVTVPAYFNDAQRQATKDAATIAGFRSINIINEPTAAALAFDHENKKLNKRNILVYDFGGGTFDVSVVKIGRSVCEVIATRGDSHLGGTDIDTTLANEFKKDYKNKFNVELNCNNIEIVRRLKSKAEQAKIALSGDGRYHFDVDMPNLGDFNYSSSLTKIRLEHLCSSLFERTIECVAQCLKDCNLNEKDIDEVVLVGGSSRIPMVRKLIKNYFGADKVNQGINPDEAVAYGAAIYAANVSGANKSEIATIIDVTSLSIGTNVENDMMSVIIPRNKPLPASGTVRYQTVHDDQESMDFPIYQGENMKASENILLGEFTMTQLTKAPARTVRIEVTCRVDQDGLLSVSAEEINTTNTRKILIDVKKCGLTDEEIQKRVRDAELNNDRTRRRLKFEEEKYLLQAVLNQAIEMGGKPDTPNKDDILDRYDEICKWLEKAQVSDTDRITEFNKELTRLLNDSEVVSS